MNQYLDEENLINGGSEGGFLVRVGAWEKFQELISGEDIY